VYVCVLFGRERKRNHGGDDDDEAHKHAT
jgi:hypothetical protein